MSGESMLSAGRSITPELRLSGREALILAWMFFPPAGEQPLTLKDAARRLGVTEARIQQTHTKLTNRLRWYGMHYGPTDENRGKTP